MKKGIKRLWKKKRAVAKNKQTVTKEELKILEQLSFPLKLIEELRPLTVGEIKRLNKIDEESGDELEDEYANGIFIACSETQADIVLNTRLHDFQHSGYQLFCNESELQGYGIAVIKANEMWDILRYRLMNGDNYELTPEKLISQLKAWDVVLIYGVGRDWVEIEFQDFPKDPVAFAREVHEFCPDIVDQGLGSIERLEDYLDVSTRIRLWWD